MPSQYRPVVSSLSVFVIAVACSGSAPSSTSIDRQHGIPIRASEVRGPGTPLPDGFSVPAGAVLAGAALPERPTFFSSGKLLDKRRWSAILGVGGAPKAVAGALLRQAKAAGLPGLPAEPYCQRDGCAFSNGDTTRDPSGRLVNVHVDAEGRRGTSASVRFTDFGGPDIAVLTPVRSTGVPPLPRKPAPGRLPSARESVGFDEPTITVIENTAMIMPIESPNGPQQAVLRVTGDPRAAYRGYVRQLRAAYPSAGTKRTDDTRLDDWIVSTTEASIEATTFTVDLLTRRGRSYIRLTSAH
jgi:hypothetical protein